MAEKFSFRRLGPGDVRLLRALNQVFAEAFDDAANYAAAPPDEAYLAALLAKEGFIALAALERERVIGGLVAYELDKFEQVRREIYVYDLAVVASHRRRGGARGLLSLLRRIARQRNAYVIYVQADYGDEPAIALYSRLGRREDVMHFDIDPAE
jgi:aminoglycoside 3-N-acetyltransferase I